MRDVIDLKDALERVQDDKELLAELFDIFMEDFPTKRDAIRAAAEKGDRNTFQQIAHGLKGATGNISAAAMHANSIELDRMGKDGSLEGAIAKLDLLDQQFEDFKKEAERLKKEFAG